MTDLTTLDPDRIYSAIRAGVRAALTDNGFVSLEPLITEAIRAGVADAMPSEADITDAIIRGVDIAFGVYGEQVLMAIADGTREALKGP